MAPPPGDTSRPRSRPAGSPRPAAPTCGSRSGRTAALPVLPERGAGPPGCSVGTKKLRTAATGGAGAAGPLSPALFSAGQRTLGGAEPGDRAPVPSVSLSSRAGGGKEEKEG